MSSTGQQQSPDLRKTPAVSKPVSSSEARSVNVRFRARASADANAECAFVCECGRVGCLSATVMTFAEHDWIRARTGWFAVSPGHQQPADSVIQVHDRYLVVTRST